MMSAMDEREKIMSVIAPNLGAIQDERCPKCGGIDTDIAAGGQRPDGSYVCWFDCACGHAWRTSIPAATYLAE